MFDFILKLIETKMKIKIIKMCGLDVGVCELKMSYKEKLMWR